MNLRALLLGLCPRCRKGRMFPSTLLGAIGMMNSACSECGLPFLKEAGYYTGAMYLSYAMGVLTILPVSIVLAVVLDWHLALVAVVAILQTVISMPLFLRFSRTIWLHVDESLDPR